MIQKEVDVFKMEVGSSPIDVLYSITTPLNKGKLILLLDSANWKYYSFWEVPL
jgi:hypothetical protein